MPDPSRDGSGSPSRSGAKDEETIDLFEAFFGCGRTTWRRRRRSHYDDEVTFVRAAAPRPRGGDRPVHGRAPSAFLQARASTKVWRAALLDYWEHSARRRRTVHRGRLRAPSQRAKGLCRRHYYEAFGSVIAVARGRAAVRIGTQCGDTASVRGGAADSISLVVGSALADAHDQPCLGVVGARQGRVAPRRPPSRPRSYWARSGETVYAFAQVGTTMYVGGRFAQLA